MRRTALVIASFVCLLYCSTGCNAPDSRSPDVPKLSYGQARAFDLMDILEINVSAGVGLLATVAVEPIKVGYGYYQASKAGMMGRAAGTWDECRKEVFVGLHHLNAWHKRPCRGNGFLFTPEALHRRHWQRDPNDTTRLRFYEEWGWTTRYEDIENHWLDVSAEVHLLFVGLNVCLSPQELFDFLLGLCTVDSVSHDDREAVPEGVTEQEFIVEHERF